MKHSQFAAIIFAYLSVTPAFAFDLADLDRCKAIHADAPRLACFDAVASQAPGGGPSDQPADSSPDSATKQSAIDAAVADSADTGTTPVQSSDSSPNAGTDMGTWQVSVEIDPITDAKIVTAAAESDAPAQSFRAPTLFVRCKSKVPEVFISWGQYLGDMTVLTLRIDQLKPTSASWTQSTDQTATFAPDPHAFLKSMKDSKRVSARITPYRSGPLTANFPTTGIDNLLTFYSDACGEDAAK